MTFEGTLHNYVVCSGNGKVSGAGIPSNPPPNYYRMGGMFDPALPEFLWLGKSQIRNSRKIKLTDVTDGLSNTLMMSELRQGQTDQRGLIWVGYLAGFSTFAPPNTSRPDVMTASCHPIPGMPCPGLGSTERESWIGYARSKHHGGVNATLGDASVRFITNSISPDAWFWMGPIDDGHAIGDID
jgi:hypothetical protein